MKKLLFIFLIFFSVSAKAQRPNFQWSKTFDLSEKLVFKNDTITGISNDTTYGRSKYKLLNEKATKDYIAKKYGYLSPDTNHFSYYKINDSTWVLKLKRQFIDDSIGGGGSLLPFNYIISAEPIEKSIDTVKVIPNIIFYQDGVRDTITVGAQYKISYASSGQKRIDEIIIDNGALDTLKGVEDSSTVVPRTLTGSQILLAYVNVYGTDSIVVEQPGTYEATAIVYIGSDGKLKTSSGRLSFSESSNKISIGLGTEKLTLEAVPGDYVGGSTGLFRAENLQLQSTRASGGTLTKDLDNEWIRPSGNEYRMFLNSASKYLNISHDAANAKYIFKLSSKSPYTGNDLIGLQFGYKNRVVIGDSLVAADSCASCAVDIRSLTKGFRTPQMTALQMNAISSPATGLQVFNTTANEPYYFNGTSWVSMAGTAGTPQTLDDAATEGNEILNKTVVIKTNPAAYSGPEITFDPNGIYGGHLVVKGAIPLVTSEYTPIGIINRTNTYLYPTGITDSTFTLPTTFQLNGNYYAPSATTGVVNFGTIAGGSTDTTNLLTKTRTQTVTGQTTFNNTSVGTANMIVNGGVYTGTDAVGLLINGTYSNPLGAHPLRVDATSSPTANGAAGAATDFIIRSGGSFDLDHLIAGQFTTIHGSSGGIKNLFGGQFQLTNNGGVDTNSYSLFLKNPTGSGTIQSNTALLIEDQTKGTTNMGIRVAGTTPIEVGGISYLLGNTIVGSTAGTAPTATLSVRKNSAGASFNIQNNGGIFQMTMPSSSTDISFGNGVNNYAKFYNGGFKSFYALGGDSTGRSGLWVNHSFGTAYRSGTSTSVTLNTNDVSYTGDATPGATTVNLPSGSGIQGRIYEVRKSDASANAITVAGTINGGTNFILSKQNDIVGLRSDGTNWTVVYAYLSGESISTVSTYTNYTTTATYQNIASITLAPGTWQISAFGSIDANSATLTSTANSIFVISTTTASASGATEGLNMAYVSQAALSGTANRISTSIAPYTVTPTTSTTYYLNTQSTFSAGNPQFVGTIRAVRLK